MSENFKIIDVRNKLSDAQKQEILSLWKKEGAELDAEQASKRLDEIFAIAVTPDEKIAAVSSTFQAVDPVLNVKLHYLRIFVGDDMRQLKVATELLRFISDTLNNEYNPGDMEQPIGSAWIVENEAVNSTYTRAVSRKTRSVYYANDESGHPARVRYFTGAKITV